MLLKKLTEAFAPSGREDSVRDIIKNEVKDFADEVYTDVLGNLVAHKKGNGKKIMLAAHTDEIGIAVNYIDKNGFIRFSAVGGVYTKRLLNRRVVFANGTVGVIDTEADNKDNKIEKLYIDIGAKDKEDCEKKVSVGDMAVFCGEFVEQGDVVISKALDNRAGCFALIEAIKKVKGDNDLYFCFTTQEEVGLRGAMACAYNVMPEYAIAVDVTDTGDVPEGLQMAVELGCGAAVKVMDQSVITHPEVRTTLIELAKRKNIPYQLEVLTAGGTDAGVIHTTGAGVKTGGISIPTRYIHSPAEMIAKSDLDAVCDLVCAFCENEF